MRLLAQLTVGYVAVLVSALAASLIAILVYLRRIGNTLGEVRALLARVRDETAPLGGHLGAVNEASTSVADGMSQAREHLARAADQLAALSGPSEPGAA